MPRIEYRLKTFPELGMLRLQGGGPGLLQGKTMAQAVSRGVQVWIQQSSTSNGLSMPIIIIITACILLAIVLILIAHRRQNYN